MRDISTNRDWVKSLSKSQLAEFIAGELTVFPNVEDIRQINIDEPVIINVGMIMDRHYRLDPVENLIWWLSQPKEFMTYEKGKLKLFQANNESK